MRSSTWVLFPECTLACYVYLLFHLALQTLHWPPVTECFNVSKRSKYRLIKHRVVGHLTASGGESCFESQYLIFISSRQKEEKMVLFCLCSNDRDRVFCQITLVDCRPEYSTLICNLYYRICTQKLLLLLQFTCLK